MSDKPISVGDLVVVVRGTRCCGVAGNIGLVYRVALIRPEAHWHCTYCRSHEREPLVAAASHINGYQLSRLKRIPPLDELESERTDEPMKEPA